MLNICTNNSKRGICSVTYCANLSANSEVLSASSASRLTISSRLQVHLRVPSLNTLPGGLSPSPLPSPPERCLQPAPGTSRPTVSGQLPVRSLPARNSSDLRSPAISLNAPKHRLQPAPVSNSPRVTSPASLYQLSPASSHLQVHRHIVSSSSWRTGSHRSPVPVSKCT
jgi:hypothetical protein